MAKYEWEVRRAVVEEEIVFPSKEAYRSYLRSLDVRDEPYKVVGESIDGGCYVVVMRKRYGEYAFLGECDPSFMSQEEINYWRSAWEK